MITSTQNPKVKWVRALLDDRKRRSEENAFVVEGVRLAEEALASSWEGLLSFYTREIDERGRRVVDRFSERGVVVEEITPQVMHACSDTQTPQGILAVMAMRNPPLPGKPNFVFVPDGVRDPGNLGTMLRSSSAAGVEAVLLPPETVDPYSPKVLRAGMGAHFRLNLRDLSWEEIGQYVQQCGLKVYLAEANVGEVYYRADFRTPLALIIGGEAEGAGRAARNLSEESVHIPMPGGGESLNAAIAAAILMFEVVRQRARQ
jgi:RNA methyltransferase, TrmH family